MRAGSSAPDSNSPCATGSPTVQGRAKALRSLPGFAIADRLGSIRQTRPPHRPPRLHGSSSGLARGGCSSSSPAATAVPFNQYRLLHDFGWGDAGKPARQALSARCSACRRPAGRARSTTPRPGTRPTRTTSASSTGCCGRSGQNGRLERPGYIFLGSWFLDQLGTRPGSGWTGRSSGTSRRSRGSFTGCWRTTGSRTAMRAASGRRISLEHEPLRDARVDLRAGARQCRGGHAGLRCDRALDPRYRFRRERVLDTRSGWVTQLVVNRTPRRRSDPRSGPRRPLPRRVLVSASG